MERVGEKDVKGAGERLEEGSVRRSREVRDHRVRASIWRGRKTRQERLEMAGRGVKMSYGGREGWGKVWGDNESKGRVTEGEL